MSLSDAVRMDSSVRLIEIVVAEALREPRIASLHRLSSVLYRQENDGYFSWYI